MDEGLFARHAHQLRKRDNAKGEIIECVQDATGITLLESEISLTKKEVRLHLSSVKKSRLVQKDVTSILQAKGYTLRS